MKSIFDIRRHYEKTKIGDCVEQILFSSSLLYKYMTNKIQSTIILPVLFCCETWSLILRMEQRLRFFEHRMLRKIFGFERDEINMERRRL